MRRIRVRKEEQVVEAGRLADRRHQVTSVARSIGDHLAAGSAVISATGAKLARRTRNLAGQHGEPMPDRVRIAVDEALAAEIGRQRDWQDSVLRIPPPRLATR
jgi:hypothetical protein